MTLRNGVFAKPLTEIVTESQMYSSAFRVIGIAERLRMGILNLPTQFGKEEEMSYLIHFYFTRFVTFITLKHYFSYKFLRLMKTSVIFATVNALFFLPLSFVTFESFP